VCFSSFACNPILKTSSSSSSEEDEEEEDSASTTTPNNNNNSSSSRQEPKQKQKQKKDDKSVHFSHTDTRYFPIMIGDNPSTDHGLPLTVDWDYWYDDDDDDEHDDGHDGDDDDDDDGHGEDEDKNDAESSRTGSSGSRSSSSRYEDISVYDSMTELMKEPKMGEHEMILRPIERLQILRRAGYTFDELKIALSRLHPK